jgi:hypothetical protein
VPAPYGWAAMRQAGPEVRPKSLRGKGWRCTKELKPGDELSSHDGQWIQVESVADSREIATVYNVNVDEHHTYFVGSAIWGFSVWAHNADYFFEASTGRLYQLGRDGSGRTRT